MLQLYGEALFMFKDLWCTTSLCDMTEELESVWDILLRLHSLRSKLNKHVCFDCLLMFWLIDYILGNRNILPECFLFSEVQNRLPIL